MFILRNILTPIKHVLRITPHMRAREHMFTSTLLACITPFTNSKSSNLLRSLCSLFGMQSLTTRQFYSMMASPKLPWRPVWNKIWEMIPSPATDGRLLTVLDDSMNTKTGEKAFGCSHVFDHAAKANQSQYPWAQNMVMLGLLKKVKGRWSCIPLAYCFYLPLIYCEEWLKGIISGQGLKRKQKFRTKMEQARLMLIKVARFFDAPVLVVADSWFGNNGLLAPTRKVLGDSFHILSRLRCNIAVYDLPPTKIPGTRGRPRKYGEKWGRVDDIGDELRDEASTIEVFLYGKIRTVAIATREVMIKCLRSKARVVWVYHKSGSVAFFTSDLSLTCEQIVEYYGARWKIEACFKELKQDIGSSKSQTRKEVSVKNHVNFCLMATAITWIYASRMEQTPERRFHVNGRSGFAFSDVRSIITKTALTKDFEGLCHQNSKDIVNLSVNDLLQMVA